MVEQQRNLDAVFHALSDPTRRALLKDVAKRGSKTVSELAEPHAMSLAAVSKHLDVLEHASLIHRERQGTSRIVTLRPGALRSAHQWLAFYQSFWQSSLDRLEAHFEQQSAPRPKKRKDT